MDRDGDIASNTEVESYRSGDGEGKAWKAWGYGKG
mgnify:CR=1 FL=1